MTKLLDLPAKLKTLVRDWDKLVETKAWWELPSSTCFYLRFLILPLAFTATAPEWFLSITASPDPCQVKWLSYLHRQAGMPLKDCGSKKQTNKQRSKMHDLGN